MHAFVSFFVYRSMSYRVLCVVLSPFEDRSGEQGQVFFFLLAVLHWLRVCLCAWNRRGGKGRGGGGGEKWRGY